MLALRWRRLRSAALPASVFRVCHAVPSPRTPRGQAYRRDERVSHPCRYLRQELWPPDDERQGMVNGTTSTFAPNTGVTGTGKRYWSCRKMSTISNSVAFAQPTARALGRGSAPSHQISRLRIAALTTWRLPPRSNVAVTATVLRGWAYRLVCDFALTSITMSLAKLSIDCACASRVVSGAATQSAGSAAAGASVLTGGRTRKLSRTGIAERRRPPPDHVRTASVT